MKVLLDTNVLLDSMRQRVPWNVDADAILAAGKAGNLDLFITSLTVSNVFYVCRQVVGSAAARVEIHDVINEFFILGVDEKTLVDADAIVSLDFEDNIQIAAAVFANLDYICTRDPGGFSASSVPVISPANLVKLLQGTP